VEPIGQRRHLGRCILRGWARIANTSEREIVLRIAVIPIERARAAAPLQPPGVVGLRVEEHERVRVQAAVLDPRLPARPLVFGLAPTGMTIEQRGRVVPVEVIADGRDFLAGGFGTGVPEQIPGRSPFKQFVVLALGGHFVAEEVIVEMLAPGQRSGGGADGEFEIGADVIARGLAVTLVSGQGAQRVENAQRDARRDKGWRRPRRGRFREARAAPARLFRARRACARRSRRPTRACAWIRTHPAPWPAGCRRTYAPAPDSRAWPPRRRRKGPAAR
jgi:hypothetical protein